MVHYVNSKPPPTHEELLQAQDKRTAIRKIIDAVLAILKDLFHIFIEMPYRLIFTNCSKYKRVDQDPSWKEKSEGLCIVISGLFAYPQGLEPISTKIEQEKNLDLYIPYIPHRGNCPLEQAALPIYNVALSWIRKNPSKKLCLIGHSRGSWIANWIQSKLKKDSPDTHVKILSIAGPHLGSPCIDSYMKLGMHKIPNFVDKAVWEEMKYQSEFASNLSKELIEIEPEFQDKRFVEFWGSTEDAFCSTLSTALPTLNNIHIVHGSSHNSIIRDVSDEVYTSCKTWFEA